MDAHLDSQKKASMMMQMTMAEHSHMEYIAFQLPPPKLPYLLTRVRSALSRTRRSPRVQTLRRNCMEGRKIFNCCNRGRSAMPRLRPIPQNLISIFSSARFRAGQRRYNGSFAFTGLGAGGIKKRTWTGLPAPFTLTLHGTTYQHERLKQRTFLHLRLRILFSISIATS